jgi:hypothetical protein
LKNEAAPFGAGLAENFTTFVIIGLANAHSSLSAIYPLAIFEAISAPLLNLVCFRIGVQLLLLPVQDYVSSLSIVSRRWKQGSPLSCMGLFAGLMDLSCHM